MSESEIVHPESGRFEELREDSHIRAMAERDRYLVTFYQRTPETKPIMHAYGPYTALEAARAKGSLPEEHVARGSVLHQRVVKAIWADPRTGIIREEPDD